MKLYQWATGTGKKPTYPNTLEGDPLAYAGPRPVVVSLWATWAAVWTAATEQIIRDLQGEFAGRCEFVYIEANDRSVRESYKVDVVPAVLVFHGGQEVGRFINLSEADALRQCVAQRASSSAGPNQRQG
jgi:thioredoxin-like negative regulator of GroEL